MKTDVFFNKLSSVQIQENIAKHFNAKVNLSKYSREQLEDMRNKFNDLLTNENYQKDKAMLELLNTRIKEMLGEQIKQLKDKMIELSEGKKGVKVAKHPKGSKGSGDGNLANNYPPFDKVTRGDVVAGALGKDQKGGKAGKPFQEAVKDKVCPKCGEKQHTGKCAVEEGFDDMMKAVADRNKGTEAGKKSKSKTGHEVDRSKPGVVKATKVAPKEKDVKEAAKKAKEPFAVGMAAAKKEAGIKKTPAKDLPKAVVKKGHEIGKSIKKSQKNESLLTYRRNVKLVNESLQYLINEDEEEKAQAITSAGDMANDFTSWMQRVGQYQTKVMIELSDEIRHNFGPAEAEAFKQAVSPALAATLETLTSQREVISNAIAQLAGGQVPTPMGAAPTPEMPAEPAPEPSAPDMMNEPGDEFAASDAAAGAGASGREMRENRFMRKIAESHSIISKLAK